MTEPDKTRIPHIELHEWQLEGLLHTLQSARHAFGNPNVSVVAIPLRPEELRNYQPPPEHHSFWDRLRRKDRVVYIPVVTRDDA